MEYYFFSFPHLKQHQALKITISAYQSDMFSHSPAFKMKGWRMMFKVGRVSSGYFK